MSRKAKVVLTGQSGVGKSSIIFRFYRTGELNTSSTVGGALFRKRLTQPNKTTRKDDVIEVDIWDTAGQERFRSISPFYFRNCNYCLLVFDLNDWDSFIAADTWRESCELALPDKRIVYFLIGNKCDIGLRAVTTHAITTYCQKYNIARYLETSAKEGIGITDLEEALNSHLWSNFENLPLDTYSVSAPSSQTEESKSLCAC